MRTLTKLLLAALAATALLAIAATTTPARLLEIPNALRGFRIAWSPLTMEAAGSSIRCRTTLEGEIETFTVMKAALFRIGRVTRATVGACERGHATALTETLPWEVHYSSFSGTLPNITAVTISFVLALQVEVGGITCLARATTERPARGIARVTGQTITGFRADETAAIETVGGFFCGFGGAAHFSGEASSITTREGGESIRIRLI